MIRTGGTNYFTIWNIEEKNGRVDGRASTSRKNKATNEYVNSNWNVRFVGEAAEKAKSLVAKDKITVEAGDLSLENITLPPRDGEDKGRPYLSVTIFNFSKQNDVAPVAPTSDELPF